ncbi:nose resistant to fluoxetine protein 6-like [Fopius arisanus]|uniref:Nose resistant to fluoxetine protein 6-like n=1 Tax=Fopius arisanus TaxID=64838 RepID=A0A9R1SWN3_9HYME|nr:PREDICTED: nose resistant to fluoxetine protein 6-like [Fopius arisanus]XP_011298500.1 PREDICTED: nose resistant to fluoxetine protein 6-like [Fopius arisanus]XP_011298501.1 PREDICTED: nose resistant to fluoxetine protein 6-like [Fopius arisanus]
MYNSKNRNGQAHLYRYNLLSGLWFLMILRRADGFNLSIATSHVIPAYAIASKAGLLIDSSPCHQELKLFKEAVDAHVLWSLRMLDSSGQPKSGFIHGNNYWLGHERQCDIIMNSESLALSPKVLKNNSIYRKSGEELVPFKLKFFVAYFVHNSTLQYNIVQPGEDLITLGLCLPAKCTTGELSQILTSMFQERTLLFGHINNADFRLQEVKAITRDLSDFFNFRMIIMGLLMLVTALIIIAATTYDLCVHQKNLRTADLCADIMTNGKPLNVDSRSFEELSPARASKNVIKVLMCFSAYTNSKDIFSISIKKDSIEALHGIRSLGMTWIILLHMALFGFTYMDNKVTAYQLAQSLPLQIMSNGSVSVDIFFFMSGFLLAYTFFENARKRSQDSMNGTLSWRIFFHRIIRRYIRLTPPYVIVIGIADMIFSWYDKNSQFYIHDRPFETCPTYWWRNILYINNLFKRSETCLFWSYYLSNDMQFFIIGSFILFLSQRYYYVGMGIFLTLFIGTTITSGVIAYTNEYAPTLDEQLNTLDKFYDPPWMRMGPYLVGLATAYILVVTLRRRLHVKRTTLWLLWGLGISCSVLSLFGLWKRKITLVPTSFYMALHRTAFGIGIAWLVVACCTNHGGIINRILSLKIWQPFSKLSYCAYLLNPIFIGIFHLSGESPYHAEIMSLGYLTSGVVVISYLGAYFLSVMFEIPFSLLANIYFEGKTKEKNQPLRNTLSKNRIT